MAKEKIIGKIPVPGFRCSIPVHPDDQERFMKGIKHYGMTAKKQGVTDYFDVTGTDPTNLYWLGANMFGQIPTSPLTKRSF